MFILTFCLVSQSQAQNNVHIKGKVLDQHGQTVSGATVVINAKQTTTNAQGDYSVSLNANGIYKIILNAVGYLKLEKEIKVTASERVFDFVLKESINTLDNVTIVGKTETDKAKEQAVKSTVIDLQDAYNKPATVTELMNRTAGVRIRQTGGLGASSDVSLNGFQGKSVKYFKDGIPLDYLGDGFTLSALPANMLQRIEVFKGVLPVALGADALGGAVNLISRKPSKKYLETGYELASFNTHRFNLNGFYTDTASKWFAGVDAFFNHSDNNYEALIRATDPITRNQYDANVPLFHNAYTGYFAQFYAGLSNRTWADEIKFELSTFSNRREQQHPALMTDPYGAVLSKQSSIIPSINYKKSLFNDKLNINQFLTYSNLNINRIDTLRGQYDWFGNFTPNPLKVGESRQPSNSDIDSRNFTSRTNLSFRLADNHNLELNNVFTSASRDGSDPLGARFSGTDIDILSIKSSYRKLVTSLGISSDFFDKKLNHVLMGKFFNYSASGVEAYEARPIFSNEIKSISDNSWGIADAVKYEINNRSLVRFSAEYANRLPDQNELFGDAIFVVPNFDLKPERSLNFNLGYRYNKSSSYTFEVNTFYRRTKNLILLVPIQQPYAHFENQENVKGYGVELDGNIYLTKNLIVNANATFQDLRLFDVSTADGGAEKNDARLRNTPYFFANAGLNYNLNKFKAYGYYSFVREYYLETIPKRLESGGFLGLGSSANINSLLLIPNQHLVTVGANYAFLDNQLSVGVEAKNLLDNNLYDNYRVQKAGRSFHLKLNYIIK
ncbi:TonB-dependent receptor [Pedobacter namyangjuensis]|uniref:TonB-dependent receptor n=1 Tax=Pedobacter namyangjuensis TaxID=600626 RepID=UPI0013B38890|nr:TonB-dependent receptor [Pedobacter namyangjuensis]